jgi:hypothetical protein
VRQEATPSTTGASNGPSKTYKTDSEWNDLLSYSEYLQMPAAERSAFADSFENPEDFSSWLKATKRIYEAEQKDNSVGSDGVIDMEQLEP